MITAYYDWMLGLSLAMTLIYVFMWHKHFDVHITLTFVLVPVTNLGFVLMARARTLEEALVANSIAYIGGCYMLLIVVFIVFSLCHIRLSRWIRLGLTALSSAAFLSMLTTGRTGWFYREVAFERVDGVAVFTKQYGFMHAAFQALILAYFTMCLGAILYSYFRKKQVSRKLIYLLFMPAAVSVVGFFANRRLIPGVELLPACYTFALAIYLVIVYRICLYDITDTAVDTLVETGDTGFVSFDFSFNYLGSNSTAKSVMPELRQLTVDGPIDSMGPLADTILQWLRDFRADETKNQVRYDRDGSNYQVAVSWLYDGHRKRGYQLFLTDDTADQQYISLLSTFNSELQSEVAEKTAHIVEMHDKLILGMATMVESRDNSTGGHIRRTSEGVRLLIGEMRQDPAFALSESFCRNIVKAAPMHDLGKIAVDDAVLRKPGRFTPEEFEKMKAHADEGARIVHEILNGVEDDEFRRIAENVAHYHHERWDGSGYPEGLKGDDIPLEARIMAIADVYDALVSKRVYKESMSFEQADAIIMDGMGRHFDARLEPCYVSARPKLEAYYSSLQ